MANIPYIHRIYGVFFNKCDKLACLLVEISILNQDSASLSEIGRPSEQLGWPISARSTDFILLRTGPNMYGVSRAPSDFRLPAS